MKTLLELKESIEKGNEAFNQMTKAEQRVSVTKDCLTRIKLGQLIPNDGNFLHVPLSKRYLKNGSIKNVINNESKFKCNVCAKGALFMGYVGKVNEFDFEDYESDNRINYPQSIKLMELFTSLQLDLIEIAFEGVSYLRIASGVNKEKAKEFYLNYCYDGNKNLLVAICNNIIKNKGTFRP